MAPRILLTGVWHETNTFAAGSTGLADFHAYQYAEGQALVERYAGTGTEAGGVLAAAAVAGLEVVPALFAGAVPSGTITADAFARLVEATRARIAVAGRLDGAVVLLHGAMVAEAEPEADAAYLEAVRGALPPGVPVTATFDIHANLSARLVHSSDVLVGYDTYPHTDMAERGAEATRLLARLLAGAERPAVAFRKLPLLPVPQVQLTEAEPMRGVIAELHAAERDPAVWTASVAVGFPYADVAHPGMAVVAYAATPAAADAAADRVAGHAWRHRHGFRPELADPDAAVAEAIALAPGPVVLADVADNVGGGAPGDGTVILAALLRAAAPSAVVVLWDPPAVAVALAAGSGGAFDAEVGGRSDRLHGPPVRLAGRVDFAGRLAYRRGGSYMAGQDVDLGDGAVVRAGGVAVLLTGRRAMPFDLDHLRAAGIEPAATGILVVKSATAWRAPFGPVARAFRHVDTPGVCASDLGRFRYRRFDGRAWPLDRTVAWPA